VKRRGDDTKYVARVLLYPMEVARYFNDLNSSVSIPFLF
jgi:uncharacterized protein VirK/YbjX